MPARDASGRFVAGAGSGGVKIKIELNSAGIIELLQSEEIEDDLDRRAHAVVQQAGEEDYESHSWVGFDRARATIKPATYKGRLDEARDKRLTRSLDAARR